MTFENTRGIYSIKLDNGITVMSIRDYAFMLRDTIALSRKSLAIGLDDVVDFVFMKTDIDSDDDVLLGIQYHYEYSDARESYESHFAIVGCKKDCYCTYDEMIEYLRNQ
jgi:hypothetical protein